MIAASVRRTPALNQSYKKSIFDFLLTDGRVLAIIGRWVRFSSICPGARAMVRAA